MKRILNKTIISLLILIMLLVSCSVMSNIANAAESNDNVIIKYYYTQLDDTSKKIYNSLENNIDSLKKENFSMKFSTEFNELLHEASGQEKLSLAFQSALDAFFYDYPELFYIDLTKISLFITCYSMGGINTYTVEISPGDNKNFLYDSFGSEEEVNNAITKVENVKNKIINSLKNESDYKKVLGVHNTLVNSIKYDSTLSNSNIHNIYGALIENKAVCDGYAKAFKYILDSLNIESILVRGTASNSSNNNEAHMWNYIKLDDNWYGVDVTWDDPVVVGDTSTTDILRHDYFLKGNNVFGQSHIPSGIISNSGMIFSIPELSYEDYKEREIPFNDVKEGAWYYDAVKYVYKNNIIKGLNGNTFAPTSKLTRGMLVTILHRMEGSPAVSEVSKFSDVQNESFYYYTAVKWATQNNIISGYNSGKFGPNDPITREQLAVILSKYCKYKGKYKAATANLSSYKDASKISSFAKEGMNWAVASGVITGNATSKTLNPQGTTTRAEAASMLYKYCSNVK